jgi:hypothetical protein
VKHPVGEPVHLGMSAFAGVATQGVGQADYLLQDLECRTMKEASAGFTAGRLPTEGTQLPRLANGTDDKVAVGTRCRRSHLFPPFPNCTAHARVRPECGLESERYRGHHRHRYEERSKEEENAWHRGLQAQVSLAHLVAPSQRGLLNNPLSSFCPRWSVPLLVRWPSLRQTPRAVDLLPLLPSLW